MSFHNIQYMKDYVQKSTQNIITIPSWLNSNQYLLIKECLRPQNVKTPVFARSQKLSNVESCQYLDQEHIGDNKYYNLGYESGVIYNISELEI